jgi:hypothetical protein
MKVWELREALAMRDPDDLVGVCEEGDPDSLAEVVSHSVGSINGVRCISLRVPAMALPSSSFEDALHDLAAHASEIESDASNLEFAVRRLQDKLKGGK